VLCETLPLLAAHAGGDNSERGPGGDLLFSSLPYSVRVRKNVFLFSSFSSSAVAQSFQHPWDGQSWLPPSLSFAAIAPVIVNAESFDRAFSCGPFFFPCIPVSAALR